MRLALALLTCVFLVGCGGSIQDKMIGDWQVDMDYLKNMEEFKKLPAEQQGMASMMSGVKLSITEDEIQFEMAFMGQSQKKNMPYTIKEDKGDSLVVETDDSGKKETAHIRFDGDIMILFKPGDKDPALPFKRKE